MECLPLPMQHVIGDNPDMNEGVPGHLRPDLIEKLVTAISHLVWSKQAALDLFRNAGVPDGLFRDFQDQLQRDKDRVKKPIMARTILQRMNDAGDAPNAIRMRRELVRRVVEWKDYTTCPPNCDAIARGAVAAVQEVVGKYDFLTEIRQDRDRRVSEHMHKVEVEREAHARRVTEWQSIKTDFAKCFGCADPHERGRAFEKVMNRLFLHANLSARPPFTLRGESGKPLEQIDGSIELEHFIYVIEIKWWAQPVEQKEMGAFGMKVFLRDGTQVRGLFISASNYTEGAVQTATEAFAKGRPIILMTLKEFFDVLQADGEVRQLLLDRVRLMLDQKRIIPNL